MEKQIENKVAASGLLSFDISDVLPKSERIELDIKDQLWQGMVLKEKDFRNYISATDWSQYQNKCVAIYCSTDAVIPHWAYMLLTVALQPYACHIAFGNIADLEKNICIETIAKLNIKPFIDKRVIIKGCSNLYNPEIAMVELTKKLIPVVKSLMFGEACSTVPIYKKK